MVDPTGHFLAILFLDRTSCTGIVLARVAVSRPKIRSNDDSRWRERAQTLCCSHRPTVAQKLGMINTDHDYAEKDKGHPQVAELIRFLPGSKEHSNSRPPISA